jgi:hypothetical protein
MFVANIRSAVREIIFMNLCLWAVQGVTFGTNIRTSSKHQNNEHSSDERVCRKAPFRCRSPVLVTVVSDGASYLR